MNKRGASAFVVLMLAVIFFLLGLALAPALLDVTDSARTLQTHPSNASDTSGLDCNNTSISTQDKTICTSIDTMTPLFIGVIFGLGGLLVGRIAL